MDYFSTCQSVEDAKKLYKKLLMQYHLWKIINLDCQIEIIGYWIYCFNSKKVKEELKELGFWFSSKHEAWVYSGNPKKKGGTLDEIRAKKGHRKTEKEEQEKDKKEYPLKVAV
jgi:hypothetical protein